MSIVLSTEQQLKQQELKAIADQLVGALVLSNDIDNVEIDDNLVPIFEFFDADLSGEIKSVEVLNLANHINDLSTDENINKIFDSSGAIKINLNLDINKDFISLYPASSEINEVTNFGSVDNGDNIETALNGSRVLFAKSEAVTDNGRIKIFDNSGNLQSQRTGTDLNNNLGVVSNNFGQEIKINENDMMIASSDTSIYIEDLSSGIDYDGFFLKNPEGDVLNPELLGGNTSVEINDDYAVVSIYGNIDDSFTLLVYDLNSGDPSTPILDFSDPTGDLSSGDTGLDLALDGDKLIVGGAYKLRSLINDNLTGSFARTYDLNAGVRTASFTDGEPVVENYETTVEIFGNIGVMNTKTLETQLFDINTGESIGVINHADGVSGSFSEKKAHEYKLENGKLVVSTGEGGNAKLKIYDITNGSLVDTIQNIPGATGPIKFDFDGNQISIHNGDDGATLYNVDITPQEQKDISALNAILDAKNNNILFENPTNSINDEQFINAYIALQGDGTNSTAKTDLLTQFANFQETEPPARQASENLQNLFFSLFNGKSDISEAQELMDILSSPNSSQRTRYIDSLETNMNLGESSDLTSAILTNHSNGYSMSSGFTIADYNLFNNFASRTTDSDTDREFMFQLLTGTDDSWANSLDDLFNSGLQSPANIDILKQAFETPNLYQDFNQSQNFIELYDNRKYLYLNEFINTAKSSNPDNNKYLDSIKLTAENNLNEKVAKTLKRNAVNNANLERVLNINELNQLDNIANQGATNDQLDLLFDLISTSADTATIDAYTNIFNDGNASTQEINTYGKYLANTNIKANPDLENMFLDKFNDSKLDEAEDILDITKVKNFFNESTGMEYIFDVANMNGITGQDQNPVFNISNNGSNLTLSGNTWKSFKLPSDYNTSNNTIISFEVSKNNLDTEIGAIGILTPGQNYNLNNIEPEYQIYGSQTLGIQDYVVSNLPDDDFVQITIPVGKNLNQDISEIVIIHDNDAMNQNAATTFRNLRIYENVTDSDSQNLFENSLINIKNGEATYFNAGEDKLILEALQALHEQGINIDRELGSSNFNNVKSFNSLGNTNKQDRVNYLKYLLTDIPQNNNNQWINTYTNLFLSNSINDDIRTVYDSAFANDTLHTNKSSTTYGTSYKQLFFNYISDPNKFEFARSLNNLSKDRGSSSDFYVDTLIRAETLGKNSSIGDILTKYSSEGIVLDKVLSENEIDQILFIKTQGANNKQIEELFNFISTNSDPDLINAYVQMFNDGPPTAQETTLFVSANSLTELQTDGPIKDLFYSYFTNAADLDSAERLVDILNKNSISKALYVESLETISNQGKSAAVLEILHSHSERNLILDSSLNISNYNKLDNFINNHSDSSSENREDLFEYLINNQGRDWGDSYISMFDQNKDSTIRDSLFESAFRTPEVLNSSKYANIFLDFFDADKDNYAQGLINITISGNPDLDKYIDSLKIAADYNMSDRMVGVFERNLDINYNLDRVFNNTDYDRFNLLLANGANNDHLDRLFRYISDEVDVDIIESYTDMFVDGNVSGYKIALYDRAAANTSYINQAGANKIQDYFIREMKNSFDAQAVEAQYILDIADNAQGLTSNQSYIDTIENIYSNLDSIFDDEGLAESGGDEELLEALQNNHSANLEIERSTNNTDLNDFKIFSDRSNDTEQDRTRLVKYMLEGVPPGNSADWVDSFDYIFANSIVDNNYRNLFENAYENPTMHATNKITNYISEGVSNNKFYSQIFLKLVEADKYYYADTYNEVTQTGANDLDHYLENIQMASVMNMPDEMANILRRNAEANEALPRMLTEYEMEQFRVMINSGNAVDEDYDKMLKLVTTNVDDELVDAFEWMFEDGSVNDEKEALLDRLIIGDLTQRGIINNPDEFPNKADRVVILVDKVINTNLRNGEYLGDGITEIYTAEQQKDDFLQLFNIREFNATLPDINTLDQNIDDKRRISEQGWPLPYSLSFATALITVQEFDTNTPENINLGDENNLINDYQPTIYKILDNNGSPLVVDSITGFAEEGTAFQIWLDEDDIQRFTILENTGYMVGTLLDGTEYNNTDIFTETGMDEHTEYRSNTYDEIFLLPPAKDLISDPIEKNNQQINVNDKVALHLKLLRGNDHPKVVVELQDYATMEEFYQTASLDIFNEIDNLNEIFVDDNYSIVFEELKDEHNFLDYLAEYETDDFARSLVNFEAAQDFAANRAEILTNNGDLLGTNEMKDAEEIIDKKIKALDDVFRMGNDIDRTLLLNDFRFIENLDEIYNRFSYEETNLYENLIYNFDEDGITRFVNETLEELLEIDEANRAAGVPYYLRRESVEFTMSTINSMLEDPSTPIFELNRNQTFTSKYDEQKFFTDNALEKSYLHNPSYELNYERLIFGITDKQKELLENMPSSPERDETLFQLEEFLSFQDRTRDDALEYQTEIAGKSLKNIQDEREKELELIDYFNSSFGGSAPPSDLSIFKDIVETNTDEYSEELIKAYADFQSAGEITAATQIKNILEHERINGQNFTTPSKDIDASYISFTNNLLTLSDDLKAAGTSNADKNAEYFEAIAQVLLSDPDEYSDDQASLDYITDLANYSQNALNAGNNNFLNINSSDINLLSSELDKEVELYTYFKDQSPGEPSAEEINDFINLFNGKTTEYDTDLIKAYIDADTANETAKINDILTLMTYKGDKGFIVNAGTHLLDDSILEVSADIVELLNELDGINSYDSEQADTYLEQTISVLLNRQDQYLADTDSMDYIKETIKIVSDTKDISLVADSSITPGIDPGDLSELITTFTEDNFKAIDSRNITRKGENTDRVSSGGFTLRFRDLDGSNVAKAEA
ncbi:MAG: hypothetical protein MK033_04960 [Candidatus Caenarcaniphilales bacterium]|nr:hypothetical protein [Candidatus Caenarcaniphilales bacterium]